MKKKKPIKVERSGVRVRLFRKGPTWWLDVRLNGKRERISLRTSERATAEASAEAYADEKAKATLLGITSNTLTLGQLFDWFRNALGTKLNKKGTPVSRDWKVAAETRMQLFERIWNRETKVVDIGQFHVDAYVSKRRSGALSSLAPADAEKGRKAISVRLGTTDGDLRWLKACFNYATKHQRNGEPFLASNPLVRVSWPRENERNKLRPRATLDRYEKTLAVSDTVDPSGRLRCALALARHTGHRESSILKLRVSDLLLSTDQVARSLALLGRPESDADHMPFGAILWRADNDKMGAAHVSALNRPAREQLDLYLISSGHVGDAWLFPGPKSSAEPLGRRLAARLLERAEGAAGLEKLKGGTWHPYRRAWATERKHLPDADVAATGGWGDTRALKLSYQQSDAATQYQVVSHGT